MQEYQYFQISPASGPDTGETMNLSKEICQDYIQPQLAIEGWQGSFSICPLSPCLLNREHGSLDKI